MYSDFLLFDYAGMRRSMLPRSPSKPGAKGDKEMKEDENVVR
jgi:hypothetical protein